MTSFKLQHKGTFILLIAFLAILFIIVAVKKTHGYEYEPISPFLNGTMHDLVLNCMQGNSVTEGDDIHTELCDKIMTLYHNYCKYGTWCFNTLNSDSKDIKKQIEKEIENKK